MYCPHCGKELKGEQAFCAYCGAKLPKPGQKQEARKDPSSAHQKQQSAQPAVKSVGFLDAILCFYKNYANFKGRATRKEYWYIVLYMLLNWILWPQRNRRDDRFRLWQLGLCRFCHSV